MTWSRISRRQLPTQRCEIPFCQGRLDTCSLGFQTRCVQESDDFAVELRVAVEDDVTIPGSLGKSLTQLLDRPFCSRVSRCVEVQDLAPSVFDDEEAVQQFECHGRHAEEVEGRDHLTVVPEKGQPTFAWITASPKSAQITAYASFGDNEAWLKKLTVCQGRSERDHQGGARGDHVQILRAVFPVLAKYVHHEPLSETWGGSRESGSPESRIGEGGMGVALQTNHAQRN